MEAIISGVIGVIVAMTYFWLIFVPLKESNSKTKRIIAYISLIMILGLCGLGLWKIDYIVHLSFKIFPSELEKEWKKVDKFCSNLDLKDFTYDCSKWWNSNEQYNTTDIPRPFTVRCEWDTPSVYHSYYEHNVGCSISYLKDRYSDMEIYAVNMCSGNSLEETFNFCIERLPTEIIDGIKIIRPSQS